MSAEVAVNGRFEGRRVTGVDRYASEMLRCLGRRTRLIRPRGPVTGMRGHFWEQFILPRLISESELLWSPANSGPLAVSRQAVTIHDISVLEHPEWFAPAFHLWYAMLFPWLARRAQIVLTVSENSRQAIIKRFDLAEQKVISSPNGVNSHRFHPCDHKSVRGKYGLPEHYVLFVGSLDPRKNLGRLLQAWEKLTDFPEVALVIAGSKTTIFRAVQTPECSKRVRYLGYVPDEDLPGLYSGAAFFAMPSLFEGFGLTVLEAMACGTPVLTSNAGALPEVTGEAAVLVDPFDVEQMTSAMRTLLLDEGLRLSLRGKGMERACQFSWEESAERIWSLLSNHG